MSSDHLAQVTTQVRIEWRLGDAFGSGDDCSEAPDVVLFDPDTPEEYPGGCCPALGATADACRVQTHKWCRFSQMGASVCPCLHVCGKLGAGHTA